MRSAGTTNMNPFEGGLGGREARLKYGDAEFHVITPGDYVRCAVTGRRIGLAQLRYWSVDLQEAYDSAETATKRMLGLDT